MPPAVREAAWVWAGLGLVGLATVVTYWRLPPEETYRVSGSGAAGGLGRALVYLNFPVALVAIGVLAVVVGRAAEARPRAAVPVALLALGLCLVVAGPGVVEEHDLDAKAVNALPALGVLLVLGLTVVALGRPGARRGARGDPLRLALAAVVLAGSLPWIFAELGFYAPWPFVADEPSPGEPIAAVHLGRHHGMDGALLALAALALSRRLDAVRPARLRIAAAAWLSLMLVYGLANALEDGWHEQVVKRGWTDVGLPSMLRPGPSWAWGAVVAAAVLVGAALLYEARSSSQASHSDIGT